MPPPVHGERRLGIIDLGSNSARLMIASYTPGQSFKIADEISRRVRLSEGMGEEKKLKPAGIARTVATLRLFCDFCWANGVKRIIPVATAAVRDAANRPEFLDRVRAATGLQFRVLTGEEEAYAGVLAAINSLDLRAGLTLEVGGGSTQVSVIRGRRFERGHTYPLGAVRLTESYLTSDPVAPAEVTHLAHHIGTLFAPLDWMALKPGEPLVGMGGTIRALARMDVLGQGYPLDVIHGYELTLSRLEVLLDRLRALPVSERARNVPGLPPDRADIILAGVMVVAGALRRAGADRLVVCNQGVRESLLYREFLRPADPPIIRDLRKFSVLNLARAYGGETAHTAHVAKLALALFDQLSPLHGYGTLEREVLWAASQLHEIGKVVDYYDYPKHSAYLILNSGLPGYSHREMALIALVCRYHLWGKPALEPYLSLLQPGDAERINRLAALLRLVECLDRSQTQIVTGLRMHITGERVRLRVRVRRRAEGRVEVWEAQRNADLLEEVFGCKLEIEMTNDK